MVEIIQLKNAEAIKQDILDEISAETNINDKNLGSAIRSSAYAVGVELDEMYYQLYKATKAFYIHSSTKTALDNKAADFDLTREPAQKAVGVGRFSANSSGGSIPAGTLISAPATTSRDKIQYITLNTTPVAVAPSSTADIPISAVNAGVSGNLADNQITQMDTTISGIVGVTNPAATDLGWDEESDDELRARIIRTIRGLSKGTIPSILNGAIDFRVQSLTLARALPTGQAYLEVSEDLNLYPIATSGLVGLNNNAEVVAYNGIDTTVDPHRLTGLTRGQASTSDQDHEIGVATKEYVPTGKSERVVDATISESPGAVDVTIYDGTSAGATTELKDLVQKRLIGDGTDRNPGYRGGGIYLTVFVAGVLTRDVTTQVVVKKGYSDAGTKANVATTISTLMNSHKLEEIFYAYKLAAAIMGVEGVEDIDSLVIGGVAFDGSDSANVVTSTGQVVRAGSITVN